MYYLLSLLQSPGDRHHYTHLINEEAFAQRGEMACPKSYTGVHGRAKLDSEAFPPFPRRKTPYSSPKVPHIPRRASTHLPHSSVRLYFPPAVSAAPHPQYSRPGQPLPLKPHPSIAGSPAPDVPSGCRAEQGKSEVVERQKIRIFAEIYKALGPCTYFIIHFTPVTLL